MSQRSKWCLIGVPDHQAVLNVGGRLGTARGPASFRQIFARMNGLVPVRSACQDLGDVPIVSSIEANHEAAAGRIAAGHREHGLSLVVGGGHDHGYSHLLGVARALGFPKKKPRLGCINIDAHLDVRKPDPAITSGSPFYMAIESSVLDPKRFEEFGIQSHCNGPELWEYVKKKKVKVTEYAALRHGKAVKAFAASLARVAKGCDALVVSFDLDAVVASSAPGVSAPQAEGILPSEAIEMMELAGANRKACSLGIFELNPEHDPEQLTARLAATSAWHFFEAALKRR
jgi:formiminoglutamase